jgi:hypothetical protein
MNIFYLDNDPKTCAQMHVDKHCVKMILEYAQLLSTAHRVLDGTLGISLSNSGRKRQTYTLNSALDGILYSATHINHPSAVWVRQSDDNYIWLYNLWRQLMIEYTYRYGKNHACEKLIESLCIVPQNIRTGNFTQPTPAMPDHYKVAGDSIQSYKNYYVGDKQRMFSWKNRNTPSWLTK